MPNWQLQVDSHTANLPDEKSEPESLVKPIYRRSASGSGSSLFNQKRGQVTALETTAARLTDFQCSFAISEAIRTNSHLLEHPNVEIAKRRILGVTMMSTGFDFAAGFPN